MAVMTFEDLPPRASEIPLTNRRVAADVIDLIISDADRATGQAAQAGRRLGEQQGREGRLHRQRPLADRGQDGRGRATSGLGHGWNGSDRDFTPRSPVGGTMWT